ncbi:thiamine diphosphokinase [Bacillus rubiinfantis]|uniref:thiamine diphosphokinase n=1 Tax=Bacillus rubiinfantis TaxID=1499680 RepID=UPI0005AAA536|nr:thiamine diphosphokinase [Bacillus rubiinfantis]
MIINILAGGPEGQLSDLTEYTQKDSIWAGVDRGVFHLINRGIRPVIAFGDFDSVSDHEWLMIETEVAEINRFRPEKDETDMELALNWALKQQPQKIRIFGATGGRLDHLLANIQLLLLPFNQKHHAEVYLIDRYNEVFLTGPGMYTLRKQASHKYISFLPLTLQVANLTLEGFKYPLKNRHISIGSTLCISNELVDDYGTFSFSEGILIVIRSHD